MFGSCSKVDFYFACTQGSFQLLVTVTDKDSTSSDLVDRLYIEVSVSVSSRFSPILAYEGTARWAFLYLSARATNIVTTMAPSSPCSSGCCECYFTVME